MRAAGAGLVTLLLCAAGNVLAQSGVTVAGIVRDSATRQPVTGAIVEIAGLDRQHAVRTDEVGEFRILDVQPGAYRAVFRRIGYAITTREIIVGQGMKRIEIGMSPLARTLREVRVRGEGTGIYGQIGTSADLKAIVGAVVQVAGTRDSATTDSIGAYFMPVKAAGRYMIRVRAPGYVEEMYIVDVKRNQVADGSRLLDAGESRHVPAILWADFDQRLSWRTRNDAALLSGSDVRRAGSSITGALKGSGEMVARGLRLGSTVCVFVNGQPKPGYIFDAIRPEEVTAIEVYGGKGGAGPLLASSWPRRMPCSETGEKPVRGGQVNYLVIWTK